MCEKFANDKNDEILDIIIHHILKEDSKVIDIFIEEFHRYILLKNFIDIFY
jgi:hypothetical protein